MSDIIAKKNLLSRLWDGFTDRVDELRKDLDKNHTYLSPAQRLENLRVDIGNEVKAAGWTVSPNVIDALCDGGAKMMTLDASTVTIDHQEPAGEAQEGEAETAAQEDAQAEAPPPDHSPGDKPAPAATVSAQEYQRLVTPAAIRSRAGA
jgi:hypothetical protein